MFYGKQKNENVRKPEAASEISFAAMVGNSTCLSFDESPVQRMVGLEFQTFSGNWNVYKSTGRYVPAKTQEYHAENTRQAPCRGFQTLAVVIPDHAEKLSGGSGFKIETDGSDLEYITDAFDDKDEAQRNELERAARDAGAAHNSLDWAGQSPVPGMRMALYKKGKLASTQLSDGCISFTNGEGQQYVINRSGEPTAHPQATAGIQIDKLLDFMDKLTDGSTVSTYGHTTFSSNTPAGGTGAVQNFAFRQHQAVRIGVGSTKSIGRDQESLKAAFSLIVMFEQCRNVYKEAVPQGKDIAAYMEAELSYVRNAKNMMPVMPRTSFMSVYKTLDDNNRQKVLDVLRYWPQTDIIMGQERKMDDEINPGKFTVTVGDYVEAFEKFEEYCNSINLSQQQELPGAQDDAMPLGLGDLEEPILLEPGDPAPRAIFSSVNELDEGSLSEETKSKYKITRATDIGHDTVVDGISNKIEGMIVELRALPNNLPTSQWGDMAKYVVELVHYHNNPHGAEAPLPVFRPQQSILDEVPQAMGRNRGNLNLPVVRTIKQANPRAPKLTIPRPANLVISKRVNRLLPPI